MDLLNARMAIIGVLQDGKAKMNEILTETDIDAEVMRKAIVGMKEDGKVTLSAGYYTLVQEPSSTRDELINRNLAELSERMNRRLDIADLDLKCRSLERLSETIGGEVGTLLLEVRNDLRAAVNG